MKKILSLILALVLVFALASCGSIKDTNSNVDTSKTQAETESTDIEDSSDTNKDTNKDTNSSNGFFGETSPLTVPNIVGMNISDAQKQYSEFDFKIITEYSDEYDKGVITKQEQKPGAKPNKDKVLEVWVSMGPQIAVVPDVYEYDINAAKEELKKKGFSNFVEVIEESEVYRPDCVIRTMPKRQTEVPLSTKIYIYVATPTVKSAEVPNVISMNIPDAIDLLKKKGFTVATPIEIPSDKPKGIVLKQDIPAGEWRDQGTEIVLTISSGKNS